MFSALSWTDRRLRLLRSDCSLAGCEIVRRSVESLSLRDVDRRLAQLLLEESADYGRHQGDSVTFELALTHQQIAARIGSVREVVSRAFARLQSSGLVIVNERTVTIPDKRALRDYALE